MSEEGEIREEPQRSQPRDIPGRPETEPTSHPANVHPRLAGHQASRWNLAPPVPASPFPSPSDLSLTPPPLYSSQPSYSLSEYLQRYEETEWARVTQPSIFDPQLLQSAAEYWGLPSVPVSPPPYFQNLRPADVAHQAPNRQRHLDNQPQQNRSPDQPLPGVIPRPQPRRQVRPPASTAAPPSWTWTSGLVFGNQPQQTPLELPGIPMSPPPSNRNPPMGLFQSPHPQSRPENRPQQPRSQSRSHGNPPEPTPPTATIVQRGFGSMVPQPPSPKPPFAQFGGGWGDKYRKKPKQNETMNEEQSNGDSQSVMLKQKREPESDSENDVDQKDQHCS